MPKSANPNPNPVRCGGLVMLSLSMYITVMYPTVFLSVSHIPYLMAHMNYNAMMIAEPTYLNPYLRTYNMMPNICQNQI